MIRMPQFEPKAGQRWAEDDQIFQASFDQNRKWAIYMEHILPCGTIAITYWVATIFGFNICKCNSIAENHWNCESELHIWGRRPVMPSLLIASENIVLVQFLVAELCLGEANALLWMKFHNFYVLQDVVYQLWWVCNVYIPFTYLGCILTNM